MFRLFQLASAGAATPPKIGDLWDDFRFRLPHASAKLFIQADLAGKTESKSEPECNWTAIRRARFSDAARSASPMVCA